MYRTLVTICNAQWSLYVPHSGHYIYHQFNIQQFHVLPTQCIYVFCVDLRTNSDYFPISTYSINWLVCITEIQSVYCAVRAGFFITVCCDTSSSFFLNGLMLFPCRYVPVTAPDDLSAKRSASSPRQVHKIYKMSLTVSLLCRNVLQLNCELLQNIFTFPFISDYNFMILFKFYLVLFLLM